MAKFTSNQITIQQILSTISNPLTYQISLNIPFLLLLTFTLMTKTIVTSHPNIAIIKYWGKEDVDKNICANMSISLPLTKFITTTSIEYSETDKFILNGVEQEMPRRMLKMIDSFRKIAKDNRRVVIDSSNNFPDSCGVASSASGYSALVKALDSFYKTKFNVKNLSILARMCSGSASRSIPPGITLCNKESSLSLGFWPEIKIFFILISKEPKKVSSTEGMIRTMNSSFFYRDRLSRIDEKINLCIEYIETKDFSSLCRMIIRDSNELHSVMFETYPPIRYINDEGYKVMTLVDDYNERNGLKMAYTFDAGPNPFIITLEEYVREVKSILNEYDLIECN